MTDLEQAARQNDGANSRPSADLSAARPPLALTRLHLINFRSYINAELKLDAAPVVLAGANGSGKTNCLEAISLFSPGKGMRGAKLVDVQRRAPVDPASSQSDSSLGAFGASPWAVAASATRGDDAHDIGTGLIAATGDGAPRRAVHLNGAPGASADLALILPMLWLTPAQDRLFLEGASERRRFLDRLVFGLDPAHARRATRYETAMRERARLLRESRLDPVWLDGLEETMAQTGADMTKARLSTIVRLNEELSLRGAKGAFPAAHLALDDAMGDGAQDESALRAAFARMRMRDAESGRTLVGPHLADLSVRHTAKRADARECSTGEQKALLISIVLANARAQSTHFDGTPPLLLLDEIAAHLDVKRRAALFEEILDLRVQAWMTGTDTNLFTPLEGRAQFFAVNSGQFVSMSS